jgi:initiation factor 1A
MVKNDGGNKGKGLARKHVNAAKCGSTKQLRVATDAAERYAIVSKMLGNGMCYVRLLDGSTRDRLCIIRNKFKGRGKRDNILDSGSWVLVGMREWSSKQDTCDLLEVYNAAERDRLQKNEPVFKTVEVSSGTSSNGNDGNNNPNTNSSSSSNSVQFADSTTMKYSSMLNKGASASADSDDDVPMQQRVYDMPPSDEEDEEGDQEEDDQEEADQEEDDQEEADQEEDDQSDSDQSDEEADQEEEAEEVQVQVHKSNAKKAMNKCEINVDDI